MLIFEFMNAYDILLKPYENYTQFQIILEILGATFGILSVYFSTKRNILVFPTGLVSTIIYVYILYHSGLLGDCIINIYYSIMSIYGWFLWNKSKEDKVHVSVAWTSKKEWKTATLLFLISCLFVITIYYFKPYLDSPTSNDMPSLGLYHLDWANWTDIFTTSIFLVGMWLMAKQRIENWFFWILGDFICIPMMISKGLGITSVQYLVFTIMAIIGYVSWKKSFE